MQLYFKQPRRNMEDDLFFENGRQPQFFKKLEDDIKFFENGRRPQHLKKMEGNFKYFSKWKTTSNCFINGR
jgi:hypothetical protein